MVFKRRYGTLAILFIGVAVSVAAAWLKWGESTSFADTATLLSRFPVEDATVLSVDVAKLRSGGFLPPSKIALEPEYRQFLEGTGFDYRRDLDQLVASFSASGNFFIARGRFDWPKLRAYAERRGGSCYQDLCRMQGSIPERHISFLPLRNDALALAVSTDDLAASRLTRAGKPVTAPIPSAPAWISIRAAALRQPGALPPAMRLMLSKLTTADRIVFAIGSASTGKLEVTLDASCRTASDAEVLTSQLRSATAILKDTKTNDDLARALVSGTFNQADRRVAGKWPVGRGLLESLTDGI